MSFFKRLLRERNRNLALTYANDIQMDGSAAQLQRIYGIYALSRALRVPYVHSPLKKLGYQGLEALESNSVSKDLIERYNNLFYIKSDISIPKTAEYILLKHPTKRDIDELLYSNVKNSQFILARIALPYKILDKQPDIYQFASNISPFNTRHDKDVFRIAIHVRRGDLIFSAPDRILPNSYYINVSKQICEILSELNIAFSCDLYTELPTRKFTVDPENRGLPHSIDYKFDLNPKQDNIEEFNTLPNLRTFVNLDPIETISQMATANALVMSLSSFSYLAAILNPKGAILYRPFWHAPLSRWFVVEDHQFSHSAMRRHVETFKHDA